jgi:hypothetical protein
MKWRQKHLRTFFRYNVRPPPPRESAPRDDPHPIPRISIFTLRVVAQMPNPPRPEHQHSRLLPHMTASFPHTLPPPCSQRAPPPPPISPRLEIGTAESKPNDQTTANHSCGHCCRRSLISPGHGTGSAASSSSSGCATPHLAGVVLSHHRRPPTHRDNPKSKPYNQTSANSGRRRQSPISPGHGTGTVASSPSPSGCGTVHSSSTQASLTAVVESTWDWDHPVVTVGLRHAVPL